MHRYIHTSIICTFAKQTYRDSSTYFVRVPPPSPDSLRKTQKQHTANLFIHQGRAGGSSSHFRLAYLSRQPVNYTLQSLSKPVPFHLPRGGFDPQSTRRELRLYPLGRGRVQVGVHDALNRHCIQILRLTVRHEWKNMGWSTGGL